ncbi:MAG: sodium:solute symporter, partial [Bacteroidota bacterium]
MSWDLQTGQWLLVIVSSIFLIGMAPYARSANDFFRGSRQERQPNFWLLTSSLVISWLFAKSITNAANLGAAFGFVGGLAYAAYYLSFLVAGWIIYQMRVKGGFQSIHHFLGQRYGLGAIAIFSLLIGVRLFNEVWSNTMVIGSYFGPLGSTAYYAAIIVFTLLTL